MEREKDARPLPSLPSTGFPTASSGSGQTGKGAGEEPEDGATAPPPMSHLGESDQIQEHLDSHLNKEEKTTQQQQKNNDLGTSLLLGILF
jgi:hypothetical protein